MITPKEFPYVTAMHVNDCYTYKNFDILLHKYEPFSHLILTGKNGSGKTTILNYIKSYLMILLGIDPEIKGDPATLVMSLRAQARGAYIEGERTKWQNLDELNNLHKQQRKIGRIVLFEPHKPEYYYGNRFTNLIRSEILFASFEASRFIESLGVETPTKDNDFNAAIDSIDSSDFLNKNFQQYLVNKRVNQAFDRLDNREDEIKKTDDFFEKLTSILRKIFDDDKLILRFVRESYETPIKLSDDREITLKNLPAGYSGLLRILLDLFIRVDIIRKKIMNFNYDPCGIVLIDEPEAHLHLELQEQVLPLLIDLFPNIQFIVATHSPAVIASINNSTIFDLTTKETRISEDTVGRSYAELTTSHFGLENDYSTIADEYLHQVDTIIDQHTGNPAELKQQLVNWQRENARFLSPTLQVKLEYIIAQQDAKIAVAG